MYSIPVGTHTLVKYPGLYTLSKYAQKKPPKSMISETKNNKNPHTNAERSFLTYLESTTDSYNKSLNQHNIHQQNRIKMNNAMPPLIPIQLYEPKPITFFSSKRNKEMLSVNTQPIEKGNLLYKISLK